MVTPISLLTNISIFNFYKITILRALIFMDNQFHVLSQPWIQILTNRYYLQCLMTKSINLHVHQFVSGKPTNVIPTKLKVSTVLYISQKRETWNILQTFMSCYTIKYVLWKKSNDIDQLYHHLFCIHLPSVVDDVFQSPPLYPIDHHLGHCPGQGRQSN